MQSLSSDTLQITLTTLEDIKASISQLQEWNKDVVNFACLEDDSAGLKTLAADAMLIEAIGEGIKQIDQRTQGKLLIKCPEIPWHSVIGIRNVIAHGYFDVDSVVLGDVIRNDLEPLDNAIDKLINIVKSYI